MPLPSRYGSRMSETWSLPLRDDLVGVQSYGAPQLDVAARLNVNENPFAPSAAFVDDVATAVAEATRGLNRYPDRDFGALCEDLAAYLLRESGVSVAPEQVWAANGSNEIMHQLFLAFGGPGHSALSWTPTYSMYPEYARDTFTTYLTRPREADFSIDVAMALDAIEEVRPSIVVLTSPNNPTGTALPLKTIAAICEVAQGVVVVDEAYGEFRRSGTPSALEMLKDFPNLVVSRTMSKAFSLAGARLGYLVAADPRVVEACRVVRLPYHLSAITQAVARTALAHSDELLAQVDLLRRERDDLADWLTGQGFDVAQSDANFIFFGRFADRYAIWQGLLDKGVLIRETGPSEYLRVSIGTPEENMLFRNALLATMEENR